MPRPARFSAERVAEVALPVLWSEGYGATSVAEIFDRTAVSRQALYGTYADKRALLLACLNHYRRSVVDPAISLVERDGAALAEIAQYFEVQIAAAERAGSPGWGPCVMIDLSPQTAVRTFLLAFGLNFIWMNVSEVLRYLLVVKPMVRADFAMLPGIVPDTPVIGLLWTLWDIVLIFISTAISWLMIARFGLGARIAVAAGTLVWASVFVLLWLGLHNMGLARLHTILAALPLAWIELVAAAFLVHWPIARAAQRNAG